MRNCASSSCKATKEWIEFQDSIGTDLVVDGEQYRGDMVAFFAEEMPGLEIGGLVRSYGNRYYRKPIATGPVGRDKPDHGRVVGVRAVAHRQAGQGDAHRSVHDLRLVVQRALRDAA